MGLDQHTNPTAQPNPTAEPQRTLDQAPEPSNGVVPKGTHALEPPASDESDQTGESGFGPVLRNRDFMTLWSGQVFSQLSDKVYLILMISIVASRFQAEGQTISGWVSAIMIAFTIPAVLFGAFAGVYVDRWSKKAVLVITNLLRGALVFALPALLWVSKSWPALAIGSGDSVWASMPAGFLLLLLVTFLVSTLTQFFAPAEQAIMPLIVDRKHLLSANSLYTTTMMASVIIGFAVGEPLLALADAFVAHFGLTAIGLGKELVVGSGYAIAGLVLLLINPQEELFPTNEEPPHVLADIRDGLRYLKGQPQVRNAIVQLIILFSLFAALSVLAVRLAEVMPEIKSSQFGFLLAAGGVGMALGAALLGSSRQTLSRSQLALVGTGGISLSLMGLAVFSEQFWPSFVMLAGVGAAAALIGIPMQTDIQEKTPEDMRGKVFGLQNNAVNIALSVPLALAGVAETLLGIHWVFVLLAAMGIAGGILNWYTARTETDQSSNSL
jgi:MFS family permease